MSSEEQRIVIRTCDVCGEKVEKFAEVGDSVGVNEAITKITKAINWCSPQVLDVCPRCSRELLVFLSTLRRRANGNG